MGNFSEGGVMYAPIKPAITCAEAWTSAATYLIANRGEGYNLVVDIDDPVTHTSIDNGVITRVDEFLRARRANAISTVANTIFPADLHRRHGDDFVLKYLESFDAMQDPRWGRYFERLVRWPAGVRVKRAKSGGDVSSEFINPLAMLIDRIKAERSASQTHKSFYEMSLYDPVRDATRGRGRQCLSFLSFKLHPERGLMLTAQYRNHHYMSRALGNFIGLGRLMRYIANETGLLVGPLTCISTHAEFDAVPRDEKADSTDDACLGWTRAEARDLVERFARTYRNDANGAEPVGAAGKDADDDASR